MEEYSEEYKEILEYLRIYNKGKSEIELNKMAKERYDMYLIIKKDIPILGVDREIKRKKGIKNLKKKEIK